MDIQAVRDYFLQLQDSICDSLEKMDGQAKFVEDAWTRDNGGDGRTRVIESGNVIEKGGVNFSHVMGDDLPAAASAKRPELAGRSFQAMGVSLVIHPDNPYVPTSHANVRFFVAEKAGEPAVWWFGGGYDLTPYYGFEEDCKFWHQTARDAVSEFDEQLYPWMKNWCDEYFYLKHRKESRGVGGLFFDDFNSKSFDECFAITKAVAESYTKAYVPIVHKRQNMSFGEREKSFQLYRRGRYVEFNLVYDRGTIFGLQFGGRTESILMSLPPVVEWKYDWRPEVGSEEFKLTEDFLRPRDWVNVE